MIETFQRSVLNDSLAVIWLNIHVDLGIIFSFLA